MQPSTHRYLQVDVFADRPGAGNPLGVVLDAGSWDAARMQAFAAWTNLSETIFFLPTTTAGASYRIRIFTPRQELPFAGHPSVGAAWVALQAGLVAPGGRLVQECVAFAREKGYRKLVLWTQSNLAAARGIYKAEGFALKSTEKHNSFGAKLTGEYWELRL